MSDESDRHSIRIRLPLRSGVSPARARDDLFARTSLQITLPVNMLASVDGEARRLPLPALLRAYVSQLMSSAAATRHREPSAEDLIADLEALATAHQDTRRTTLEDLPASEP